MRRGCRGRGRDGRPAGRHRRVGLRVLPAVGVLVLLATALGALPASAANNGKFAIEPADVSTSTRQFFTPVLQPGVQSSDSVAVINETTSPITLQLYASDAHTTRDGVFSIEPNFKPKKAMGAWIHLPASRVTVPARSADVVHFSYNPPSTLTPGDYAGGIVAEQTSGPLVGKRSLKVQALEAVGTAVFGSIPGALHPRLAVTAVSVATSGSIASQFGGAVKATVTYSVTNTGNENLTPDATVSLAPLLGGDKTFHVHLPQNPARLHRHPQPHLRRRGALREPLGDRPGQGGRHQRLGERQRGGGPLGHRGDRRPRGPGARPPAAAPAGRPPAAGAGRARARGPRHGRPGRARSRGDPGRGRQRHGGRGAPAVTALGAAARAVAGAAIGLLAAAGAAAGAAGAAPAAPGAIELSTSTIVPGQVVTVTGSGWQDGDSLAATICGADAVAGTADCAPTSSTTLAATPDGTLWGQMTGALPPAPCPCVVLVTGVSRSYTEKIPVAVTGAPTAPVRTSAPPTATGLRLADLRVVGGTTVASAFGGAARRTLSVRITNPGTIPVTPVLVGRWGRGAQLGDAIAMPRQRALAPGRSRVVRAQFSLGALAVGTFRVGVELQDVWSAHRATLATTTSQWPLGLFACAAAILAILVWRAIAALRRLRARRKAAGAPAAAAPEGRAEGEGAGPGDAVPGGAADVPAPVPAHAPAAAGPPP